MKTELVQIQLGSIDGIILRTKVICWSLPVVSLFSLAYLIKIGTEPIMYAYIGAGICGALIFYGCLLNCIFYKFEPASEKLTDGMMGFPTGLLFGLLYSLVVASLATFVSELSENPESMVLGSSVLVAGLVTHHIRMSRAIEEFKWALIANAA